MEVVPLSDARKQAQRVHVLKRRIAVIEQLLEALPDEHQDLISAEGGSRWRSFHPKISDVSQRKFQDGHTSDAVRAAFAVLNNAVKAAVRRETGEELDGAKLMSKAFGGETPLFALADRSTQTGRDFQNGHTQILAGSMIGIRNPPAHDTVDIPESQALDQIGICSYLFSIVENAIGAYGH